MSKAIVVLTTESACDTVPAQTRPPLVYQLCLMAAAKERAALHFSSKLRPPAGDCPTKQVGSGDATFPSMPSWFWKSPPLVHF
eukprot:scaffold5989_cov47-Cyclotella_meneghiniana.AAC.10